MQIEIELPFKISTNKIYSGCHWSVRKKNKDLMKIACIGLKRFKAIENPVVVNAKFFLKGRLLDCSNTSYMYKLLEDCIVEYGILPDDSPKWVKSITLESKKSDTKKDYVVVEIKESL